MNQRTRSTWTYIYAGACFIALTSVAWLAMVPVHLGDIFMDMAVGRLIWETKSFPAEDPFVFSIPHYHWHITDEWGSHVLSFLIYSLAGFNGLVIVKTLVAGTAAGVPLWLAKRLGYRNALVPLLTAVAAYGASMRFIERASIVTDLLVPLTLAVCLLSRAKNATPRLVWALPLLFLAWVNLHPGFHVGLAIVTWTALFHWPNRKNAVSRAFLKAAALSYVACLLNPEGPGALVFPLKAVTTGSAGTLLNTVYEWLPPYHPLFITQGSVIAFFIMTVCTAVLIGSSWKAGRLFEAGFYALLVFFGFKGVRFLAFSSFALGVLAVWCLATRHRKAPRAFEIPMAPARRAKAAMAAVFILLFFWNAALLVFGHPDPTGWKRVGLGFNKESAPWRAALAIEDAGITTNIFNQHDFGPYLMWRWYGQRKLFYHGDFSPIYATDYLGVNASVRDFDRIVNQYDIGVFFLSHVPSSADSGPLLFQILHSRPEWKLIYEDALAFVFVRDTPANHEALRRALDLPASSRQ